MREPRDLTGKEWQTLVRGVSRSFYLTLRFLPASIREPISVAYLLARASDTIADAGQVALSVRLDCLDDLQNGRWDPASTELFRQTVSPAEANLLENLPTCLQIARCSQEREAIFRVWGTIMAGQQFDLTRFEDGGVLTAAERDRYIYQVAGCVGEFWTEICSRRIRRFSRTQESEMRELGVAYGCGLQLINILRDRAKDSQIGRRYLGTGEFDTVLGQARQYLLKAEAYVVAIRPWRVRFATLLPLVFGERTLDLIARRPHQPSVRIPRKDVRFWLVASLFASIVPSFIPPMMRSARTSRTRST